MAVGEIGGRCESYYFVLILVRENLILVMEKSGNFKIDLLTTPNPPFRTVGGPGKIFNFFLHNFNCT